MDKTHVQHAVRFVEHQNLHLAQVQRTLAGVVQQATRRGHQNIYAAAQLFNLCTHADTAKHHHGRQVQVFAVGANALFDLCGEFACWRHDQRAHGVDTTAVGQAGFGRQALQQGQRESSCFSRAGLCTA